MSIVATVTHLGYCWALVSNCSTGSGFFWHLRNCKGLGQGLGQNVLVSSRIKYVSLSISSQSWCWMSRFTNLGSWISSQFCHKRSRGHPWQNLMIQTINKISCIVASVLGASSNVFGTAASSWTWVLSLYDRFRVRVRGLLYYLTTDTKPNHNPNTNLNPNPTILLTLLNPITW